MNEMEVKETVKNPETNVLSLQQTSKGFWYVDKLTAAGSNVDAMFAQLDKMVEGTNKRLNDLNSAKAIKGWE